MYIGKGQIQILCLNVLTIAFAGAWFIVSANREFSCYVVIITVLLGLVAATNRTVRYPNIVLWTLTAWFIMLVIGGGFFIDDTRLSNVMILCLSAKYHILTFNQLINLVGGSAAAMTAYWFLKSSFKPDHNLRMTLLVMVVLTGAGAGAIADIIQFFVTRIVRVPTPGYTQTLLNLSACLSGSLLSLLTIRLAANRFVEPARLDLEASVVPLKPRGTRAYITLALRWSIVIILLAFAQGCLISMPGHSYKGPMPALKESEKITSENLRKHVTTLASDIGERNIARYEALEQSVDYIRNTFSNLGYQVLEQTYVVDGRTARNIEIEIPGTSLSNETVVIGGHYDSTVGTPGANDNASGTAAVLEMARLLKGQAPARKVRLVAFVNEEPPYFFTEKMGSRVYAKRCRERNENVTAMISLETIGCYSDISGSQKYPSPFNYFYPDKGNFIGFISNVSSRSLVRRSIKVFRSTAQIPSEGCAIPWWIPGVGWSDHWSFWVDGYKAIMVTDTAPFRYQYYHTPEDTPEKLDYDRMAIVVHGVLAVVKDLAGISETR